MTIQAFVTLAEKWMSRFARRRWKKCHVQVCVEVTALVTLDGGGAYWTRMAIDPRHLAVPDDVIEQLVEQGANDAILDMSRQVKPKREAE